MEQVWRPPCQQEAAHFAWVVIPALSWRISDATLVLERIAVTNQAALPPGVLTYNREIEVDHSSVTCEIDHLLPAREKECTDDNLMSSKSGSVAAFRSLLSRNLRRSTLLLWFVFYANTFAYYGIVLLTSQLSDVNRGCASGLRYVCEGIYSYIHQYTTMHFMGL